MNRSFNMSLDEERYLSTEDFRFLDSVRRSCTPRRTTSNPSRLSSSFSSPGPYENMDMEIIGTEDMVARERFTAYKIQVAVGVKEWVVLRRYSDFYLLNKQLRRQFPLFHLNLPPRRWFRNNFDPDFISKRQQGLGEFLINVLAHREIARSKPVKQFLRLDNPPEPHEDLSTSLNYATSLEFSVVEARKQVRDAEIEIQLLKREIEDLKIGCQNTEKTDVLTAKINEMQNNEQHLRSAVIESQERERQQLEEIERLKQQWKKEKDVFESILEEETRTRECEYKQKMLEYESTQAEVDQRIGQLLNAFNELPNVNVNIGGRTFEVKASDAVPQQARHLKEGIGEGAMKMFNLHRLTLESYQKQMSRLAANLRKTEQRGTAKQAELDVLQAELNHLKTRYQKDTGSRDLRMSELTQRNEELDNYSNQLEEMYFYSLIMSVKFSMAIKGRSTKFGDRFDEHELYQRLRTTGFAIDSWPAWVSRELYAAAMTQSTKVTSSGVL